MVQLSKSHSDTLLKLIVNISAADFLSAIMSHRFENSVGLCDFDL